MDQQLPLKLNDLRDMLRNLREQRRVALEEHAKVLAHASELQRMIHALNQSITPLERLLGEEETAPDSTKERVVQVHAYAAERVMKQQDRRWRIAEIIEALKVIDHPLPLEERQQYTALHSALKRRPGVFRRVERGQWVLVGSEADKATDQNESIELFGEG